MRRRRQLRRRRASKIILLTLLILFVLSCTSCSVSAKQVYTVERAVIAHIDGVITKVTADYIRKVISELRPGDILIVVLNTPGGSLDAALDIAKMFESLDKPVIAFVYPRGSYAWSAGTLILMAAHIAAMAPGTVIGSCQPVTINVLTGTVQPVNESKIVNAVIGYFSEAAKLTGKNETFVKLCVLENLNLGAEEALRYHVIDLIAQDIHDLLHKLNGSRDRLLNVTLLVKSDVKIVDVEPGILYRIRQYLTDPVALQVLSFIGFLILLLGGLTGNILVAAAGLVLILMALMLTLLPLNAAGVLMLIIGAALVLADVVSHFMSHGAMFTVGSILTAVGILLNVETVRLPYVLPGQYVTMLTALGYSALGVAIALSAIVLLLVYRVYRRRPYSETMLDLTGRRGVAVEDIEENKVGYIKIAGEYWRALALENIRKGDEVIVVGMKDGMPLVRKLRESITL